MSPPTNPNPNSTIRILVVDDEIGILRSLMREFRSLPYQFEFVNSSELAMSQVETRSYDIVISDNLMPKFTGAELLERVRQLHPQARRIMLTGKSERNGEAGIKDPTVFHAYLEKPWNKQELLDCIQTQLFQIKE